MGGFDNNRVIIIDVGILMRCGIVMKFQRFTLFDPLFHIFLFIEELFNLCNTLKAIYSSEESSN